MLGRSTVTTGSPGADGAGPEPPPVFTSTVPACSTVTGDTAAPTPPSQPMTD